MHAASSWDGYDTVRCLKCQSAGGHVNETDVYNIPQLCGEKTDIVRSRIGSLL